MERKRLRAMGACIVVALGWAELEECSPTQKQEFWHHAVKTAGGVCKVIEAVQRDGGMVRSRDDDAGGAHERF